MTLRRPLCTCESFLNYTRKPTDDCRLNNAMTLPGDGDADEDDDDDNEEDNADDEDGE